MASNILETFYILFDSNSDKVKQGAEDANASTKGLETSLTATDAAGVAMGEHLVASLGAIAGAFAAAFSVAKLAGVISSTADYNAQLAINSQRLGLSVEDLDAWSKATETAGGSAEGLVGTLDFLNKGLAGLNTPGGISRLKPFLEELHIDPKKVTTSLSLLGLLSDKAKELGAQQFAGIAERFGIDPGTQLLIAKGKISLDDLIAREKQLGVVSKADADEAYKYKQAMDELQHQFERTATGIGDYLLPGLISFFNWTGRILDYLKTHQGLVEGFFIGISGAITYVAYPAVIKLIGALFAADGAAAPWLLIATAILAVGATAALAWDDVKSFLEGNKSVTGEIVARWPVVAEIVKGAITGIGETWKWFIDYLESGWSLTQAVIGLFGALFTALETKVSGVFTGIGARFSAAFPLWAEGFETVGHAIEYVVGWLIKAAEWFGKLGLSALKVAPDAFKNWAADLNKLTGVVQGKESYSDYHAEQRKELENRIYGKPSASPPNSDTALSLTPFKGVLPPATVQSILQAQQTIHLADTTPLSAGRTTINNQHAAPKNISITTGDINIQSPTNDPEQFAKDFKTHLDNQIKQAIDHFDDGVQA